MIKRRANAKIVWARWTCMRYAPEMLTRMARRPQRRRALLLHLLAATGAMLLCIPAPPEMRHSQFEFEVAYLLNLGKFMRVTPPVRVAPLSAFDICVLGRDRMGKALDDLTAKEEIDNRPVRVRRLNEAREARSGSCD